MNTLLVPLDGSSLAESVLPYAKAYARLLSARVHLLEVIDEAIQPSLSLGDILVLAERESASHFERGYGTPTDIIMQNASQYLADRAQHLQAQGLEVTTSVQMGKPAEIIVDAAEQQNAMIVMATHGYSGLKRWALGSVADKVVHAARTPVLLIRSGAEPVLVAPPVKRVLVPLDGSERARSALPIATEIAGNAHAEMLVLTAAVPQIDMAPELMPAAALDDASRAMVAEKLRDELASVAPALEANDVAVTPIVAEGLPAEVIIDEAKQLDVDMIVMTTHGYTGLRRWALGSIADKVLHATTTPLLLVRAR